eukprot:7012535-Prymnesium_polylepis.1
MRCNRPRTHTTPSAGAPTPSGASRTSACPSASPTPRRPSATATAGTRRRPKPACTWATRAPRRDTSSRSSMGR